MKPLHLSVLFFNSLCSFLLFATNLPPTIDKQNMFHALFTFSAQLDNAITINQNTLFSNKFFDIDHIICAGVGGSAIAGDIAKVLTKHQREIPFSVLRNYVLPHWVNKKTLVILLSYSGNTEETLSCLKQAQRKQATIIGITSGGILKKQLINHHYDHVIIPPHKQPRACVGYLTISILFIMFKLNIIADPTIQLQNVIQLLKEECLIFSAPNENNPTFSLSQQIYKTLPFIYGEIDGTQAIARRWRAQFAENSKMLAATHALSELDHNEIVGWKNNPELLKNCSVLWLLDDFMHPRNKKRQSITKEIIDNYTTNQFEVTSKGTTYFEQLFYLIYFGDWLSYWLAIMHKTDPTPINAITYLKAMMSRDQNPGSQTQE